MSQSPPGRQDLASAYDLARNRMVVFGGSVGGLLFGDTWEFDGGTWTAGTSAVTPGARLGAKMAYDPVNQAVLLFGGSSSTSTTSALGDTWLWNGTTWTPLQPSVSPSPREGHAMTTDTVNQRVLLFGGRSASGACLGDTWAWTGATWVPLASGPPPRGDHAMAFDPIRNRCTLFGGDCLNLLADTWEFDGVAWTQNLVGMPRPLARSTP